MRSDVNKSINASFTVKSSLTLSKSYFYITMLLCPCNIEIRTGLMSYLQTRLKANVQYNIGVKADP